MKHDPQNKILAYLKAGGRLTVRKAEKLYHTTELRRDHQSAPENGIFHLLEQTEGRYGRRAADTV